jgi:hypothetical protein
MEAAGQGNAAAIQQIVDSRTYNRAAITDKRLFEVGPGEHVETTAYIYADILDEIDTTRLAEIGLDLSKITDTVAPIFHFSKEDGIYQLQFRAPLSQMAANYQESKKGGKLDLFPLVAASMADRYYSFSVAAAEVTGVTGATSSSGEIARIDVPLALGYDAAAQDQEMTVEFRATHGRGILDMFSGIWGK